MTALSRKEPDRVPIVEAVVDPAVIKALCPEAKDQADFEEAMQFDAVRGRPHFKRTATYPDGTYMDEWGVIYGRGSEVHDHPISGPIRTMADLSGYTPPDPNAPHRLQNLRELVKRFKGRKAIVFSQRAAFMYSAYLNGFDTLLMNLLAEPEFARSLMDKVLAANIELARNAIRAGADVISLVDDYAGNQGPFFSRALFKEFALPPLQKMVNVIHEEGAKVIKHSDGNIWPILDLIVDVGIDGLNPIEPVAGMDIGEVKKKYGERVCLVGNIDCAHLLPEGTVEEVDAAVRECISKAAHGGGHIICSSNSVHSSVRPENYLAMIKATRKYGKYPDVGMES
jgi:uroporphyrinogen decarboxylase